MMHKTIFFLALLFFAGNSYGQEQRVPEPILSDKIFEKVDVPVTYPGGEEAWKDYVESNRNKNVATDNEAPAGSYTATVKFIIDRDGRLSKLEIVKDPGYGMGKETLRLVGRIRNWVPAKIKNKPVTAYHEVSLHFDVP
ncbi:MAG: energy transducer TonB [Niastella sp.]|nr:energy transducer TonB [Niastella sp.]